MHNEGAFLRQNISKGGDGMDENVIRLVKCGYSEKNAEQICKNFEIDRDEYGLERYIRFAELVLSDWLNAKKGN